VGDNSRRGKDERLPEQAFGPEPAASPILDFDDEADGFITKNSE